MIIAAVAGWPGCAELAGADAWPGGGGAAGVGSTSMASSGGGGAGSGGGGAGDQSYASMVLADSPVGYWRLGEASSSSNASDVVASTNPGTYGADVAVGVAGLIEGDPDTAAGFSGDIDSRVSLGDALDFTAHASFTLEVWTRPAVVVLGKLLAKHTGSPINGYELRIEDDRVAMFRWVNDVAQGVSGPPLQVETRAHVVARYDGTALDSCLYVNGVLVKCAPSAGAVVDTGASLDIGRSYSGVIDEVAIYAHPLSAERIAAHHAAGIGAR